MSQFRILGLVRFTPALLSVWYALAAAGWRLAAVCAMVHIVLVPVAWVVAKLFGGIAVRSHSAVADPNPSYRLPCDVGREDEELGEHRRFARACRSFRGAPEKGGKPVRQVRRAWRYRCLPQSAY